MLDWIQSRTLLAAEQKMLSSPNPLSRPLAFMAAVLALILSAPAYTAFVISSELLCQGNGSYSYYFSRLSIGVDVAVLVGKSVILPDVSIQLVDDPQEADLVLADAFNEPSMKVCRAILSSPGTRSVYVSSTAILPNLKVELSDHPISPDHKLFVRSDNFSAEEAAALFAVILYGDRKH